MKTKEELDHIKEDIEKLNAQLAELTEDEMKLVAGGFIPPLPPCWDRPKELRPAFGLKDEDN